MALKFLDSTQQSHMPFFTQGIFLFCLKTDGVWKVHYSLDGETVHRLNTGREADAVECSPYASYCNGEWHITFIAGGAEGNRRFRLYRMVGLDDVPEAIDDSGYGFEFKERVIVGNRDNSFEIRRPQGTERWELSGVEYIYRLIASSENPNDLIISGKLLSGETFTWLVNIMEGNLRKLELDGTDAYKACVFEGDWYYAQRFGNGFEDRRIVKAEKVHMEPLDIESVVRVNGGEFKRYKRRESVQSLLGGLPEDLK